MFSTKPYEPSSDIYYVCIGTQKTSNVTKSSMADNGKVPFNGYVSTK